MDSLFEPNEIKPLIRSLQFNQQYIINSIIELHIPYGKIQVDCCYNKGRFYDNGKVEDPEYKFDIKPIYPGVEKCDCRELPFKNNSIESIMFDPPFIVNHNDRHHKNILKFGYFKTIQELEKMYYESFLEFKRILKKGGVFIIKCQDIIESHKQYLTHIDSVLLPCRELNFTLLDYFLLGSHKRIENRLGVQRFARKYHCYFLVFKKKLKGVLNE